MAQVSASVRNRTLRAVTVIEAPYVMLKPDHAKRVGIDRYEVKLRYLGISRDLNIDVSVLSPLGICRGPDAQNCPRGKVQLHS